MSPDAALEFSTRVRQLVRFARRKADAVRTRFKELLELGFINTIDFDMRVHHAEGLLTGVHQEHYLFAIGFAELLEEPVEPNRRVFEVMAVAIGTSQVIDRIPCKGVPCIVNEQNVVIETGLDRSAEAGFDGGLGRVLIDENDAILWLEIMEFKDFGQSVEIGFSKRYAFDPDVVVFFDGDQN